MIKQQMEKKNFKFSISPFYDHLVKKEYLKKTSLNFKEIAKLSNFILLFYSYSIFASQGGDHSE